MIIDNLTASHLYVEKQVKLTITCDAKHNTKGMLEVDDNGNKLVSLIDSGDTHIHRVVSYKGEGSILLYNETIKNIRMVKEGDLVDLPIDFVSGTKYFIGAEKIYSSEPVGYKFNCDLSDKNVFKIFLDNGRELKNYEADEEGVTINGLDRMYIDETSELIIYTYKTNSTTVDLTSRIDNSFTLEYYGYSTIINTETFINGEYFETFLGEELFLFESLEISQSVVKDSRKRNFASSTTSIINSVENSIDIEFLLGDAEVDLPQYMRGNEFRIVIVNDTFGRIVIINNCFINDGVSLIYTKEKDNKKFKIECGNYIDINMSSPSLYGKGKYGRNTFGSGLPVYNSARLGGVL